jgi:ATP-dependent DNA helicase RecQ
VFRQLAANGLLTVNMAEISGFRLTEKSWPVLKGAQPVRFRKDAQPLKAAQAARAASRPVAEIGGEGTQALFEKLRRLRLDIAQRLGVAPYVVFHDKTLKEMAGIRPSTPAELLGITGVGERKLEQYGVLFLSAIQEG